MFDDMFDDKEGPDDGLVIKIDAPKLQLPTRGADWIRYGTMAEAHFWWPEKITGLFDRRFNKFTVIKSIIITKDNIEHSKNYTIISPHNSFKDVYERYLDWDFSQALEKEVFDE